jgi:hypothetical protein
MVGEEKGNGQPNLGEDFQGANNALAVLAAELIPSITPAQIERLAAVIRDAQWNHPPDPKRFVYRINRILEIYDLRIQADGVGEYRLTTMTSNSPARKQFIQFSGKDRSGSFLDSKLEVVRATKIYARNGRPIKVFDNEI